MSMNGHFSLWVVLLLNCSVGFVLPRCDNFLQGSFPPETVVIPEGGGTSLFCEYGSPASVDWYKMSTVIRGSDNQDQCDCISVIIGLKRNLTFSNFMSDSAGVYGCWAVTSEGFDQCNFNVQVAVPPMIMLDQNDITGIQLGGNFIISPTIDFGLPEATVTWSQNSRVLDPSDPRVTISSEGVLTVTGVQASDRGTYTVTASNSAVPDGMTESVNVFIDFLVVDGPTFEYSPNGGLDVGCVATGYPTPVEATLSPDTGMSGSSGDADINTFDTVRSTGLTFLTCNSATTYTCMATAGAQSRSVNDMPRCMVSTNPTQPPNPPLPPPTNVMAMQMGSSFTQAIVSWDAPAGVALSDIGGYRIMFNDEVIDFVGETRATIPNLTAGVSYQISVATLRFQGDMNVVFSAMLVEFMIPCVNTPLLLSEVLGIRAFLDSMNDRRTLTVNWTASTEPGVVQYRVGVRSTDPQNPVAVEQFTTTENVMFSLPPEFCNGSTYRFTVAALDRCGRLGPQGQSVSRVCSITSGSVTSVVFGIPARGVNSLQLNIASPSLTSQNQRLFINVTNIHLINGTRWIFMYSTTSLPANGTICVGDLRLGTAYNICLSTTQVGSKVCRQESTASNGTTVEGCLFPENRVISPQKTTTTPDFPDWAIAVIVVGFFALLALLFCFIGLCFACSTNNKDYDVSSVSSLQTASIPPGPSPYMINHRNNPSSPHRSCLSYHKQGHSTNWNEHRDTLRQMDTDGGTHV